MKKLLIITSALAIGVKLKPMHAYAWYGKTHKDITSKALKLLEKQSDKKYYEFYISHKETLLTACAEPDNKGDIDKGSGMHYYCAADKKGRELADNNGYYRNRLKKYNRSARTMLEENYTMALSLYKSGNKDKAMHMLGRALHFIEDIGCVVHSSGIRYSPRANNPHSAFERYAQKKFSSVNEPESIDKRIKECCEQGLDKAANRLARYSSKYTADVRTVKEEAFDRICVNTMPTAHQYAAVVLIRFYNDSARDNGNFVTDSTRYSIKNEAALGIMTADSKKAKLSFNTKEKPQGFTAVLNDDGSFRLKADDERFIGKGFKLTKTKPLTFRAGALGKRRFRITAEINKYKKVLTLNSRGELALRRFSPEDKAAVWIINKTV
ncbi:MAG: zinc dependent phospholipase C family protein [Firmicutes bacterium]|nr:zinc dependent phospholipase C family protein [Bacillota bacterium]